MIESEVLTLINDLNTRVKVLDDRVQALEEALEEALKYQNMFKQ